MGKNYSIKEVSEIFNITTNKVRFYEKKGLINPKRDMDNDYRYFTEDDLIKLQTILMYRELDIPIEHIKDIFTDESKDNILNHFHAQWKVINNQIHRMQLIQDSLEEIMDNIYEGENETYKEKIIKVIESMNEVWEIKNNWKDKWDFNSWARTYDKSVERDSGNLKFYKYYNDILDTTFNKSIKNKEKTIKVLEIGVGTGNLADRFLKNEYDITGMDQSREMLNVAKEKYPKLKLRLGDFLNIPFENRKFDVIVSTYAFHHLNDEEKKVAIKEILRVLKDDGRIVIGDLMFENQEEKEKIMNRLTKEEIKEIEDEHYSNIQLLRNEFKRYNRELQITRMDELVFIIEVN
ncbi:methyltransferase domain-containing protein [Tissierella sp. MB52-C2]|uniref:MerR family transcriptional regulator n=1 Tax=Tissierella sp. MB52-C2 TaxID=3070999 RepID=UPI00280B4B2B|nr:methyltransferase domain-containing protein [Tissierella sp. MB52-C2]WMM23825.1 methyltransferase domain-containing protein [Tissierella sp. MB52-C2]